MCSTSQTGFFACGLIVLAVKIYRRNRNKMSEDNGTGSNAVWAIALIIIVAIIAGVVYYSGVLKTSNKKEIDINVTAPSAPAR